MGKKGNVANDPKERGVTRYDQEFTYLYQDYFDLNEIEGHHIYLHCFSAEEDVEQESMYEKVMKSNNRDQ